MFENWDWRKKKTSNDYKALGEIIEERKKRGRETDVYKGGELVSRKKVQKEISRQGFVSTVERIAKAQSQPQADENCKVSCYHIARIDC